jgi:AcrR family transcriptional regulator
MESLRSTQRTYRRRGRRPAGEDTKAALLAAATEVFAEQGFEGATMRTIAARAGIDPSMAYHWFEGKQGLFAATIELPFDLAETIDGALVGDRASVGQRLVRTFVTVWDNNRGRFAAIVHSVSSQDVAATRLREFLAATIFRAVAQHVDPEYADLRASLCASQLVGLAMLRNVLRLEPLASADVGDVVTMMAPNMQRYLTGDIHP